MLKFLTSLTFLYGLAIIILAAYSYVSYREFARYSRRRNWFPIVFGAIGIACLAFLWINFHPPLRLETFRNTDHHFIRAEGYLVNKEIELGSSDTANFPGNSYNSIKLRRRNGGKVELRSEYAEEPIYLKDDDGYVLASSSFSSIDKGISFNVGSTSMNVLANGGEDAIELAIEGSSFRTKRKIKWGISCWNLFSDESAFINSPYYRNASIIEALGQLYLVRDRLANENAGELRFFLSSAFLAQVRDVRYGNEPIAAGMLHVIREIPDGSSFAWGIGFPGNNKNQFQVKYHGKDSFSILHRYPVSYPLAGEDRDDWSDNRITKFLSSNPGDMVDMPGVFREGFMFPGNTDDPGAAFEPVLLTYHQGEAGAPLAIKTTQLTRPSSSTEVKDGNIMLAAKSGNFHWLFSIPNTLNWKLGSMQLSAGTTQWIIFGSLLLFTLLTIATSIMTPMEKRSWVWQVIACVTIIMLTTRYFLYWRYKSFPPYEGMDLPSQQQLDSPWNFFIIVMATLALAFVFGGRLLRMGLKKTRFGTGSAKFLHDGKFSNTINSLEKKPGGMKTFLGSWAGLLGLAFSIAWLNGFDPGVCRHLAIGLVLAYFLFSFFSYRRSPLVVAQENSWWRIDTSRFSHLLISNPVRMLLSLSLLALLLFIDIGFAIVFLNFLLFNESFLLINNSIAGLSTGSRRNSLFFGISGVFFLLIFLTNLLFAPYLFDWVLRLPLGGYLLAYVLAGLVIMHAVLRIYSSTSSRRNRIAGIAGTAFIFLAAFFLLPKERILSKAAMTRYRIDVMTMPADKAILSAYEEGSTWRPVIRAAQNQWFINSFIDETINPGIDETGFRLIPHAPQTRGAKYNAQATDLVASRFMLAEHGKLPVLLFVILLLLPGTVLASFYKLYPDFSNRINHGYPLLATGFSILNYLVLTALLVILAATGRYIFFGQDLPFASILSKQSILFPCILIILVVILFRSAPIEYYANRKKLAPGFAIFIILGSLLFFYSPQFNKNRDFNVPGLASRMDDFIKLRLQPVLDYFDTSASTRRLPISRKDELFSDSIRKLAANGAFEQDGKFYSKEIVSYARQDFRSHLEQERLIYLDLYSGNPRLAVNENYFRIEAPPHLQQSWRGNIYADSTQYNISYWSAKEGKLIERKLSGYTNEPETKLSGSLALSFQNPEGSFLYNDLFLVNKGGSVIRVQTNCEERLLGAGERMKLQNPWQASIIMEDGSAGTMTVEPDAFMRNYFVNGSRYYVYPLANRFIWARNLAESISTDYSEGERRDKQVALSIDMALTDSLSGILHEMLMRDPSYEDGAEYGVCVADGNGRLRVMVDAVKGLARPDPNDKAGFHRVIMGEDGYVSQSLLRKQIGNINLMRMNPGPGSTLKPIVFSAIASQLNMDWSRFASTGFTGKKDHFGGEKVAEYDFEVNAGTISGVSHFLRVSDNYYYANLLLLGSYSKQEIGDLLEKKFLERQPGDASHWPGFYYAGKQYWLDGFENWPGYANGRVNFGMENSFTSMGLLNNYDILNRVPGRADDLFSAKYDSIHFMKASSRSAFILPESATFDQYGENVDRRIPYDVFASCLRGHVKGSSQVLIPPVKMLEGFGRLASQSRNYCLTLNPYATEQPFMAFSLDPSISYQDYLRLMREEIFGGMKQVLKNGTAARLGSMLNGDSKYFYYAKTGTTGREESDSKSKLLALVISKRDLTDPDFNFRNNRFYTIYFTLQKGPAKQNEEFIRSVVQMIERSEVFRRYMRD